METEFFARSGKRSYHAPRSTDRPLRTRHPIGRQLPGNSIELGWIRYARSPVSNVSATGDIRLGHPFVSGKANWDYGGAVW